MLSSPPTVFLTLLSVLILSLPANAIKFSLPALRYPPAKCIWNAAHTNALVIVTANVGSGSNQRVDVEIIDSSPQKNVYLHKKGIVGETRLAITAHSDGEVGVCFKNYLDHGTSCTHDTKRCKEVTGAQTYLQTMLNQKHVSLIWMSTLVPT